MKAMDCAKLLGETLAKDPVIEEFGRAKVAYETSEELQGAIAEYNAQRMILGREFAKDTAMQDGDLISALRN